MAEDFEARFLALLEETKAFMYAAVSCERRLVMQGRRKESVYCYEVVGQPGQLHPGGA